MDNGDIYEVDPSSQPPLPPQGPTSLYYNKCLCICEHSSEGDEYGVDPSSQPSLPSKGPTILYNHSHLCICKYNSEGCGDGNGVDPSLNHCCPLMGQPA